MGETTILHLVLATGVLVLAGLHLALRARKLSNIAMVDIAIWMLGIFFGLGPWIAFIYADWRLTDTPSETLLIAYPSIWLFMVGLWVVGKLTVRTRAALTEQGEVIVLGRVSETILQITQTNLITIIALTGFIWGVRLTLATKYGMLFSGTQSLERELALPYSIVVMRSLGDVVATGLLIWASATLFANPLLRFPAIIWLVGECFYIFTQGRRQLLLFAVTMSLTFLAMRGKLLLRHMIAFGIIVFLLWTVLMPAFFTIRNSLLRNQSGNALVDVIQAFTAYMNIGHSDVDDAVYRKNLQARPMNINFNFSIIESQDIAGKMWGRAFVNSVIFVIPRIILPIEEKPLLTEHQVQTYYGLQKIDTSMNWPAFGVADFGLFGAFIYGIVFGSCMTFMEWLAARLCHTLPFIATCFVGVLLGLAFQVEQAPETFWTQIRDCFILLVFGFAISFFAPARPENEPVGAPA